MSRLAFGAFAALLLASAGLTQDGATVAKRELRYKFQKGDKHAFTLKHKINVKLDEIPENFQGLVPDEPFDLTFEGDVDLEVADVTAEGQASLQGKFSRLKASGSFLGQDFTFDWDRARDGDKVPEGDGDEGSPGIPSMPSIQDVLRRLPQETLKLQMDALGKVKVEGNAGEGVTGQILDLGGVTGGLPKDKVGVGDVWKHDDWLTLPSNLPMRMKVKSENTFSKMEKVNDFNCAVITSKFTVGTQEKDKKDDAELPLPMKMSFTGDGTGSMAFAAEAGRPVRNDVKMSIKINAAFNMQEGEDMALKGTFTLEQSMAARKK